MISNEKAKNPTITKQKRLIVFSYKPFIIHGHFRQLVNLTTNITLNEIYL